MNNLVSNMMAMVIAFDSQQEEMCAEFKSRANKAAEKYWDACKYPRKKKKKIRKEARVDYYFYMSISEPVIFS